MVRANGLRRAARTSIVLLCTGTPRPLPDRSGPATAIVVSNRAYLVDFGPGVVRRAAAAAEKTPALLLPTNITVAFVTHLHSDHTAGLPDLILTPWVMGRTQLDIYGPEGTEEMTEHVLAVWRRDIEIRPKVWSSGRPKVCALTTSSPVWGTKTISQSHSFSRAPWPLAAGIWISLRYSWPLRGDFRRYQSSLRP